MNDLISRQAAIDAIRGWVNKAFEDWGNAETEIRCFNAVYPLIMSLPSAQPEPQWIPCSERLPESGRYLVSCSLSVFSPQVLNYDENDVEWFYDGCKSMDVEIPTINAWMPLPEPWRGEET